MKLISRWQYVLPVALYLILAVMYLRTIPSGESPDEPSHLQCIEQVTQYNRIPIIDPMPRGTVWWARERIISGLVCGHMPLYYFMAGYTQQIVQLATGEPAHYEFPPNNPRWAKGDSPAMFQHPIENSVDEPLALTVLRLESIALGLVTLFAAGVVARRLAPGYSESSVVAMTLVAGWPQFVFMSRAINNDVLATALAAGTLVLLVNIGRPNRFMAASLLASLAVLSKITMVFAAATVVVTFAIEIALSSDRKKYTAAGIIGAACFGTTVALILLQPTLRSNYDWSQQTIASITPAAASINYWFDVLYTTIQSGWARLGWMNVFTPDWQANVWWAILGVTSIVGAWASWRTGQWRSTRLVLLVCGVWLLAIAIGYLRINLNRFQPQFRYAFASVPVLAALASAGLLTLLSRFKRLSSLLMPLLAIGLLIANLWIIQAVVISAYH